MPNPELIKFIKEELTLRANREEIASKLTQQGWKQEQIDEAFASLNLQEQALPIQPRSNYLPGWRELLSKAWQIYKDRAKTIITILIIPGILALLTIISIILSLLLVILLGKTGMLITIVVVGVFILLTILLNLWAPVALMYAIKDRDEKIGFNTSYGRSRGKIIQYIALSLISSLLMLLGLIFFIIPLIIFAVWFNFAGYILVAENLGPIKALQRSKQYVKGKWLAVFFRLLGIGLTMQIISAIFLAIPLVNVFALIILPLITTPISTIYNFLLYENLRNLNGKPLSNPPGKTFLALAGALLIIIVLCVSIIAFYTIPNLIKNLSNRPSTTYYSNEQSQQEYNLDNLSSPSASPSGGFNEMQPTVSSGSAQVSVCSTDWSNFPSTTLDGESYIFPVTFNSNFGTAMPSIYIYPDGQSLYRDSNSSGSSLDSVTVSINFTAPVAGTYTLKPYLDDYSEKGIECNEKIFTVTESYAPPAQ